MASKQAYKRLQKEFLALTKTPPPYITAKPLENNILEWHYIVRGPIGSVYEGGEYHGKLIFPSEYPFKPPAIKIITPNAGSWNPAWSVSTILTGLLNVFPEFCTLTLPPLPDYEKSATNKSTTFASISPTVQPAPDKLPDSTSEQPKNAVAELRKPNTLVSMLSSKALMALVVAVLAWLVALKVISRFEP
ncbi:Ubiquitin-conjugating enzyme E2 6 [Nowakowskiella sp. JEL0078]|nr:Ubiquitin-conjugating enzyme E2 6 [Nowakowskiella sp. JEL0078]